MSYFSGCGDALIAARIAACGLEPHSPYKRAVGLVTTGRARFPHFPLRPDCTSGECSERNAKSAKLPRVPAPEIANCNGCDPHGQTHRGKAGHTICECVFAESHSPSPFATDRFGTRNDQSSLHWPGGSDNLWPVARRAGVTLSYRLGGANEQFFLASSHTRGLRSARQHARTG